MDHEFLESLPAYAAGALLGPELLRLEEHLSSGCELCEPELYTLADLASRLAYAAPHRALPHGFKEKVRTRIQQEFPAPVIKAPRSAPSGWLAAVAALVILLSASLYWRQQIDGLEKSLRARDQEIQWLRDPAIQLALLNGLELAPGAKARMIWNPVEQKGILYVQSVPALTSGKSYQLWIIGDRGPVSGGIFEPDRAGKAVLSISGIPGQARGELQFAVTIEPQGGVPQPTGSMVLAGKPL